MTSVDGAHSRSIRCAAVALYLGVAAAFAYLTPWGSEDADADRVFMVLYVILLLSHILVGWTLALWSLVLPVLVVLIAVPQDYAGETGELPLWYWMIFFVAIPGYGLLGLTLAAKALAPRISRRLRQRDIANPS